MSTLNSFCWNVSDEEKSFLLRSTLTMKTLPMPAGSLESYTMDWWVDNLSRLLMARDICVSWPYWLLAAVNIGLQGYWS
jgi:hypothetical protein